MIGKILRIPEKVTKRECASCGQWWIVSSQNKDWTYYCVGCSSEMKKKARKNIINKESAGYRRGDDGANQG